MSCVKFRLAGWLAIAVTFCATLDASALALTGVKSRKLHGATGNWDLGIDSTQSLGSPLITTESRAIGNGHVIVFTFDGTVNATGTVAASDAFGPVGTVSAAITGASNNEISVTLTAVPDNKRVRISLTQVNGILDVEAAVGFLVADVDNSRAVGSGDVTRIKARSGQAATALSFPYDLNVSGAVNSSDISAGKARLGIGLPAINEVSLLISRIGTGGVTSMPAGINCGSTCAANFSQGTSVTLTAAPTGGSTFGGWSGGCTGASPTITFNLTGNRACMASFVAAPTVVLAWDPVASANLAGYRVYFGTSSGMYLQMPGQGLNAGMASTLTVSSGLNGGTRYYFVVRSYDGMGGESVNSNEVFRDIP